MDAMSDSGEGLVDAEARIQEQIDAREEERKRRGAVAVRDPELVRAQESIRLAIAQLEQQLEVARHPVRRDQIQHAIADLKRRLEA
jgi:hypothetical protein